jgi:hypothetical protein
MKLKGLRSTLTVQRETSSNSMGYSLYFQRNRSDLRFSSMTSQRQCRCGNAYLCPRNCKGFAVWMSGSKSLPSFGRSFVLTSNKSFSVGVTVYGFTIMGSLRILQGDTICFYSGLKLISDTHHTLLSKKTSFSTWLLAKLIPVVSVSYILSVVVLATLIYALLSLWTKLVKLKRSF